MKTTVTFLILLPLFSLTTFAQDSAQWHLPDGAKARLGKGLITEIQYSPDGTWLAVGSTIGIWLYDTRTGQEVALLVGHTGEVHRRTGGVNMHTGWNNFAFSPDGTTIASAGHTTIRLWATKTGESIRTLPAGHTRGINSFAFSPDGTTFASVRYKTIHLWDAKSGRPIRTLSGHTR